MNIGNKIESIKRYKDIALLLVKYGRSDIVKQAGIDSIVAEDREVSDEQTAKADEFASDLEKMGSTFIKLGQMLSTRADLFPDEYLESLERLQDDIEPFPYEHVEEIVAEEIGVRISKAFDEFEQVPMAAASIGQVHKAQLRDGTPVVVKVQRPGIRNEVYHDLEALDDIAQLLDEKTKIGARYEFQRTLEQLRQSLLRELDYSREASSLINLNKNLGEFENILVPLPVEDYTTSKVLTMERVNGKKITELSPLALVDLEGAQLADDLFHAYLKQMLVDGFFHADPHPGNVFLTNKGKIALLDLGMTGRLLPRFQEDLLDLLLAIGEGRGDDAASTALRMGEGKEGCDEKTFKSRVGELVISHTETNLKNLDAGRVVLEITRISADASFRLPSEFALIAKALLNLDRLVLTLDPEFDPNASIRRHAGSILSERITEGVSPGSLLSSAIDVKQLVESVPPNLNKILDLVANNELKFNVDAIDEQNLMVGFQKVANRIAMGLVLAALIIGASMLMNIETDLKIFGYPALALALFVAAVAAGGLLLYSIFVSDFLDKD